MQYNPTESNILPLYYPMDSTLIGIIISVSNQVSSQMVTQDVVTS